MSTPPVHGVRRAPQGPALDPTDRPHPADLAAQRQAAGPPPGRRTPRPATTTEKETHR